MNSIAAFMMGEAHRHEEKMVFDWEKAARMIKQTGCTEASAGLRDDWEWTGGIIFEDGKPTTEHYTYLASTWAVPEIEIDGEIYECFRMISEAPGWDANTQWPESALSLLEDNAAADGTINGRTPEEIMRKMECFKRFLQKKCSDEKYDLFGQMKLCGKCELLNADYKCDDAIMDLYEYAKQLERKISVEN